MPDIPLLGLRRHRRGRIKRPLKRWLAQFEGKEVEGSPESRAAIAYNGGCLSIQTLASAIAAALA